MALGILNNISAIYAQNNLNNTQSSLQKVLQQLSSGSRINSGADDAAGLAIANGLKSNESALTQSVQNASDASGLLQTADGALSQVTNLLNRAVTLATEAANGTLSTSQVSSANQEYQSIIAEIGNIGSTTNFNGNNVFAASATTFYVGDGTANGSTFFNDTIGALTTNAVGQSASVSTSPLSTNTVSATSVANVTIAGAKDTLSGTLSFNDGTNTFSLAVAAGTTLQQLAAQVAATGATVTSGTLATDTVLTFSHAAAAASIIGTSLTDTQGTNTLANPAAFTDAAGSATTKPSLSFAALQGANDTVVGTLNVAVSTSASATPTNLSITFAPGTTLQAAINQINGNQAFLAAGVVASNGGAATGNLKLTGPANGATTTTTKLDVTGSSLSDAPPAATVGAGTSFNGSTLTTATASAVLATVNAAINNVSYQRGIIGAYSNQLAAASNTAASENVNLTAAENSLRATNYGQATSDLAKYEVLSQTGISALAQANTVQQEILKLLQ